MSTIEGEELVPQVGEGLRVGHVHLHVGDVDEGLRFYHEILGFAVQAHIATAAFVRAGGYQHHLAFNTWRGRGAAPVPPRTVGLEHWTIEHGDAGEVEPVRARFAAAGIETAPRDGGFAVRDPWGITVEVIA
jgi:catechol 2,3-dioxygenase